MGICIWLVDTDSPAPLGKAQECKKTRGLNCPRQTCPAGVRAPSGPRARSQLQHGACKFLIVSFLNAVMDLLGVPLFVLALAALAVAGLLAWAGKQRVPALEVDLEGTRYTHMDVGFVLFSFYIFACQPGGMRVGMRRGRRAAAGQALRLQHHPLLRSSHNGDLWLRQGHVCRRGEFVGAERLSGWGWKALSLVRTGDGGPCTANMRRDCGVSVRNADDTLST